MLRGRGIPCQITTKCGDFRYTPQPPQSPHIVVIYMRGFTTLLVVCLYYNWLYTLLGLVLLVPLLLLSGKLITYLVSRQTSKSKEHDTHVFKSLYE